MSSSLARTINAFQRRGNVMKTTIVAISRMRRTVVSVHICQILYEEMYTELIGLLSWMQVTGCFYTRGV